jgi:hypothetical protein
MDLVTVVTHELGHLLGYKDGDPGVMELVLQPGVRIIPDALSSDGTMTAAASPGSTDLSPSATTGVTLSVSSVGGLGIGLSDAPLFAGGDTGTVEVALATAVPDSVTPSASGALQDGAGAQHSLSGVSLGLGQQSPSVLSPLDAVFSSATRGVTPATTVQDRPGNPAANPLNLAAPAPAVLLAGATSPASDLAGTDRDCVSIPAPTVRPPSLPTKSGGGAMRDDDEASEQAGGLLSMATASDAVLLRWQGANDACFARDLSAQLANSTPILPENAAPVTNAATVALAVVLGIGWGTQAVETERRERQRFLIRTI